MDGTLVPVHDCTTTACSKNYPRSANFQITIRARDWRIVTVG
ncbi:hypothetical protein AB4Z54_15760 [Streptomyces sp. MCAF7]